ncbi:MAG: 16S rRNA (adenine(1518)-N(6)/adenine(1519)-N(6))-dimethyltransferase RsmA [Elusimicrobia bacterium]|nr:16S rRNA (adenine(1518)-N(6)/adenine(1519)-N(6))-dimethyltransferase RsmA [Candidatus Liberimonas magnetica]
MRQPKGQNFLIDKDTAIKIVNAASLGPDDNVIEIGPGKGILTGFVAPKVNSLISIEIDKKLSIRLKDKFKNINNVTIINEDFLDYKIPDRPGNIKLVANLPYYIATAILQKLLPQKTWTTAIFMVQKEVGERIVSGKDNSAYGFLSIFCQYYAECRILFKCSPDLFFPKPLVDSVVLQITNKFPLEPDIDLFKVVKLSFSQKRKTILNSLSNALACEKPAISAVLKQADIDPTLRPENLSIDAFKDLTFLLKKCKLLK